MRTAFSTRAIYVIFVHDVSLHNRNHFNIFPFNINGPIIKAVMFETIRTNPSQNFGHSSFATKSQLSQPQNLLSPPIYKRTRETRRGTIAIETSNRPYYVKRGRYTAALPRRRKRAEFAPPAHPRIVPRIFFRFAN